MCIYTYIHILYTPIVHKHVFMISHIVGVSSVNLANIKDMKFKPKVLWHSIGRNKSHGNCFHVRPMLLLCGLRFGVALLFCRSMGELGPNQLDECGEFGLADCLCGLHCLAKSLDERRATELLGESAWPGGCFLPWIWMGHIFSEGMRGLKFANRRAHLSDLISLIEAHCLSS